MDWPANSPNLNILKNVKSCVVRKVYEKGKQYNYVKEVEDNIHTAWDSIHLDYLKQFVVSMPDRMELYLTMKGIPVNY